MRNIVRIDSNTLTLCRGAGQFCILSKVVHDHSVGWGRKVRTFVSARAPVSKLAHFERLCGRRLSQLTRELDTIRFELRGWLCAYRSRYDLLNLTCNKVAQIRNDDEDDDRSRENYHRQTQPWHRAFGSNLWTGFNSRDFGSLVKDTALFGVCAGMMVRNSYLPHWWGPYETLLGNQSESLIGAKIAEPLSCGSIAADIQFRVIHIESLEISFGKGVVSQNIRTYLEA